MKVRVLKSFVGHYGEDNTFISAGMNDIIELPEGVDWLRVGLVEVVKAEPESATVEPAEKAAKKPAKKRRLSRRSKK